MERFSLSYSQLQTEVELHPEKYGELSGLGEWREKKQEAQSGQMKLNDDTPKSMEAEAAHGMMGNHDSRMSRAKRALSEAGIS